MARKGQKIKIVVHMPENVFPVFNSASTETFWEDSIKRKLEESRISEESRNVLFDSIEKKWGKTIKGIYEKLHLH